MSNMLDTLFLDAPSSAGQALALEPDQDCLAMLFDQMSHGVVVISPHWRFFMPTKRPTMRSLALGGAVRSYPKKPVRINEGDDGDSVFILLKGSVKVFSMEESGREIT